MVFSANPLSLSVPEPAFESWLRDSGYLEILDERTTNLHHRQQQQQPQRPPPSCLPSNSIPAATTTSSFIFSQLRTIFSLFTINPFSKLTTDDFSNKTPSWTVGFIGSLDSYSFPSSPSQARLRIHENIKRYARNYAALFLLFFACTLYQMPIALFGLIGCLFFWDSFKWCSEKWGLDQYPSVQHSLIRIAQCATAVLLYCSSVQMAFFCAIAVSYIVTLLHASLRKLSPLKQSTRPDGSKWFQQNKHRS